MATATRLILAIALGAGSAAMVNAQATGSRTPTVGTSGDATNIAAGNREDNASYNHLIGSTGAKSSKADDRSSRKHGAAVPATAADIKAGSALRDVKGVSIGTVAALDTDGVVVDTGQTKIKVPLLAFGKDDQGLLLAITAAKFNELVSKAQSH